MKILLLRRRRRDGTRADNYSYKFTWRGQQVLKATAFSAELCGTHEQARADARAVARAHARALELGCVAQVEALRTRGAGPVATVADLHAAFQAGAPGRLSPNSARAAWLQLLNILRKAEVGRAAPRAPLTLPLTIICPDTLQKYEQAVLDAAAAEGASERRLNQVRRSARSTWSTARMLFSRTLRAYYATDTSDPTDPSHRPRLALPPSVNAFCKTRPFADLKVSRKRQYDIPPDHIIAATFRDLEAQRTTNPNVYAAVWLALAFGLRKGEIAGARVRDITSRDGIRGFEVCENWVQRKMKTVPKNGDEQPFIRGKNGGVARLEPLLSGRAPEDYILAGPNVSTRLQYSFQAIGAWMRGLGWGTQKTIHEFRAYAIAQVVKTEGIFEASKWARHSNVVITQSNYGHHCQQSALDVPIKLPEPPAQFSPAVLPTASSA